MVEHIGEPWCWTLEQQHAADVHVCVCALLVQKAGVRRCQPIQVLLRHAQTLPCRRAWPKRNRPMVGPPESPTAGTKLTTWMAATPEKLLLAAPRGYCAG